MLVTAGDIAGEHRGAADGQHADLARGKVLPRPVLAEELFQAAVEDALDNMGAVLDKLTEAVEDPAQVFAQSFRIAGRLHRQNVELSKVLLHTGMTLINSDKGMVPRARRDIQAATNAGRFTVRDVDLAMVTVLGAALGLAQLLHDHPNRDDAESADQVTEDLLRMLGLPTDEAREICQRPLPDLTGLFGDDTAA